MMRVVLRSAVFSITVLAALPARADKLQDAAKAFSDKDFPRVVEILDPLIRERPKLLQAFALRGRALVEIGQFQRAIDDLNKVIDEKENAGGVRYYRGRAYLSLQPPKIDEALADLNAAIAINAKVADWYYERGRAHALREDLNAAFTDVHRAIALDPERPTFYVVRGRIQIIRGSAWETFAFERDGKTYEGRRQVLKDRALLDEGVADFGRALERDPDNLEALQARRLAYESSNQMRKALDDLRAILKQTPNDHSGWVHLGWILATSRDDSLRNGKEAVAAAEKACELTKNKDPRYIDTLAAAYAENGRFKKAVEAQEKAIRLLEADAPAQAKKNFADRLALYKNKQPHREGPEPEAKPE